MAEPTGISTYLSGILPHLKSLSPVLLSWQEHPGFQVEPVPNNMNAQYGFRGHVRRLIWTQFQLPKLYQQRKANLLFSPIPEAPVYSNCRSIVMVHDLIPLRFGRAKSPLTAYFRYGVPQVLNQAEHIICNSIATAQDLEDFFKISANKITPILLAYDADRFFDRNLPTANYFLYVGRQDPYKNLQRLIAGFAAVSGEAELWIAGAIDPRYAPALQAQAEQLQIANRVKFLRYVTAEQLPILIGQAIALVFPSLWEGFGLPILEAMACGTPVITSNLASLPEVAGDAAILIDPYQVQEISEAMQMMLKSEVRSNLRAAGLARSRLFSWEKTGKETAAILEKFS
ncbi:glycosyltransferase family 4 protein [Microcoleus sp. FACHB-1515]|uniref:glycosyltransferase n=1 Tax=Cyanophyceae TaxID=3028117 RepID=UPI0016824788|nr:glycosyltransferase family 4 protein [Microcoleus sp. FACHB-1515]